MRQPEQLTIKQTPTGYWTVQRGATQLAGAATRKGAEAERELFKRHRQPQRASRHARAGPHGLTAPPVASGEHRKHRVPGAPARALRPWRSPADHSSVLLLPGAHTPGRSR